MGFYQVEIDGQARKEIRDLPGNVRQRIVRAIRSLEAETRPPSSEELDLAKVGGILDAGISAHRIRLESWRIVYVIEMLLRRDEAPP